MSLHGFVAGSQPFAIAVSKQNRTTVVTRINSESFNNFSFNRDFATSPGPLPAHVRNTVLDLDRCPVFPGQLSLDCRG
jgi:hypothetical protein